MSKKSFKGDASSLLGGTTKGTTSAKKTAVKRGRPKTSTKVITKTSQIGTKENETRATFIVREDTLEKLKAISKLEGAKIKDVVGEAFNRFIKDYEKKKGAIDSEDVLTKKTIL